MKNVTITLDENVAEWARIWAAKNKSSVSRLVGETLKNLMQHETEYDIAMKKFLSKKPVALKTSAKYPAREELYDR